MSDPWKLPCTRCDYYILVFARGMRDGDMGSGVEAAETMERHLNEFHPEISWKTYLLGLRAMDAA